jgi:uncharacterized protein DUF11
MKHHRRRSVALPVVALTLLAGAIQMPMPTASAGAEAGADYSGYATSTPVHVDAIETADTRVADVEEAFSGAAVASKGLAEIKNEVARVVSAGSDKKAYARGSGLEVGLVHSPSADNQIILKGVGQASSPPTPGAGSEEIGPLTIPPVAYASLLKGTGYTAWADNNCILGSDISRGYGYAADAQLVNAGAANPDNTFAGPVVAADIPPENVTDSVSRTRLVPNGAGDFGLVSETRQMIAPVTLLRGTGTEIKVKVAGTWVLRAVAGGVPGSASVHYGPADVSPSTPVITVMVGGTTLASITAQQILGNKGLVIGPLDLGVAQVEIAVAEPPRAIGGAAGTSATEAGDGTEASGAVDVVRIKTSLLGSLKVEDVRVGHMEARAKVPSGGIGCPIPVTKTPDPSSVAPGGSFKTTITINNPFDCDLTNVAATDDISPSKGVSFTIGDVSDGGSKTSSSASWQLGTIPAGKSRTVTVNVLASKSSKAGEIRDKVTVKGECGIGSADGTTTVSVGLNGVGTATVPVAQTAVLGVQLPRTGGPTPLYLAGAFLTLVGAAFAGIKGLRLVRQKG